VQAYACKVAIGEREERPTQHGGQLDVPLRIVQDLEQAEDVADLSRLEIAGGRVATDRDAVQSQNLDMIVRLLGQRAHQDDDVPVLDVAERVRVAVVNLELGPAGVGTDHLPNALRNHRRLTMAGVHEVDVLAGFRALIIALRIRSAPGLLVKDVQLNERLVPCGIVKRSLAMVSCECAIAKTFGLDAATRLWRSRRLLRHRSQAGGLVVVDARHRGRHDSAEDLVHEVQNPLAERKL